MSNLTPKQKKVLHFIEERLSEQGEPPNLLEIQNFIGAKTLSTVHNYIRQLESKGYLERNSDTGVRGINYIMNAGKYIGALISIPMVGTVVAGEPIEAIEEVEDYIKVDRNLIDPNCEYYALKVKGDSMKDSNVMDGDVVVVEKTSAVKNGDMTIGLHRDKGVTMKYFYTEKDGRIRMQPANPDYRPQYYDPGELQIQGKVIQIIRRT